MPELEKQVDVLKCENNLIEQKLLKNNIIINNIPMTKDKKRIDVVQKLTSDLSINCPSENISHTFRMKKIMVTN